MNTELVIMTIFKINMHFLNVDSGMKNYMILTAAALLSVFGAPPTHATSIVITGIYASSPPDGIGPDELPPFLAALNYRAIEFYTSIEITELDLQKYAIVRYEADGTPSIKLFDNITGNIPAGSYFYAASEMVAFNSLYNASVGPGETNWADNSGQATPIVVNLDSPTFGMTGDISFALAFLPSGTSGNVAQDLASATFLDRFGVPGDPLIPNHPWDFQDSWAYRKDGTIGASGATSFIASHWNFGGPGALTDKLTAEVAAIVPFGSYNVVPEPSTLALLLAGMAYLRLRGLRTRS